MWKETFTFSLYNEMATCSIMKTSRIQVPLQLWSHNKFNGKINQDKKKKIFLNMMESFFTFLVCLLFLKKKKSQKKDPTV